MLPLVTSGVSKCEAVLAVGEVSKPIPAKVEKMTLSIFHQQEGMQELRPEITVLRKK